MRKSLSPLAAPTAAVLLALVRAHAQQPEKKIPVPADYREWVYMTSGLDMTYAAAASPHTGPSVFDNVFVNPEAWRTLKQTGTWPDGTTFVLENRMAEQNVSINGGGHTQGHAVDGIELHQKRAGHQAFYVLDRDGTEHLVAKPAGCYTCHEAHAAVTPRSCSSTPPRSRSRRLRTRSARPISPNSPPHPQSKLRVHER